MNRYRVLLPGRNFVIGTQGMRNGFYAARRVQASDPADNTDCVALR